MTERTTTPQSPGLDLIGQGVVIPAHPLALNEGRRLDEQRQVALTRYYLDSGVGGIAVGVHTTQFGIREKGLYQPVLRLASETMRSWSERRVALVAGLAGHTRQAVDEALIAREEGYDAGLLSLIGLEASSEDEIILHCRRVAQVMPIIGFYIQKAVGGRRLSSEFWRRFAQIEKVIAIKVAPFNRYATVDVIRGVIASGAEERVALYTGNDDQIILDLITPFSFPRNDDFVTVYFRGGLLGHWSVWTRSVVELFERVRRFRSNDSRIDRGLAGLNGQITDCNSAFFDAANNFRGCIAGCHEVLRRQGLLRGIWCLDPNEVLSPGQLDEIDRVYREYPALNDDAFVRANLERWLS